MSSAVRSKVVEFLMGVIGMPPVIILISVHRVTADTEIYTL